MIGKDAINILKGIQRENLEENDFLGKCAIDMAIEALKEEKICPVYSDSEVMQPCVNCLECELERPQWIPVEKRLPENHHIYLVTIKKANGITFTATSYFFTKAVGWSDACVIAWMPLPDAYREETRE